MLVSEMVGYDIHVYKMSTKGVRGGLSTRVSRQVLLDQWFEEHVFCGFIFHMDYHAWIYYREVGTCLRRT